MKKRYKKLREILDQCEMRDKAEIIVENEKLKVVMFLLHVSYVHSLMSYEDLRATINPNTNQRSRKIKQ